MSTHVPPQSVWPDGHAIAATHIPMVHVCVVEHAFPQAPQWSVLALTSTHRAPHSCRPAAHEGASIVPSIGTTSAPPSLDASGAGGGLVHAAAIAAALKIHER